MKENKNMGFTFIELLGVIAIIAIISLITIPIVTKLTTNSKSKANIISIENYANGFKTQLKTWEIENPGKSFSEFVFEDMRVDGKKINCQYQEVTNEGKISLSCCQIRGEDKFYNYIDNSVIATSMCAKLNEYQFGDVISVNGEEYIVIKDSPSYQDYVVALKKDPLSINEMQEFGGDIVVTYFHNYGPVIDTSTSNDLGENGYGGIQYYTSDNCEYEYYGLLWDIQYDNCKTNYKDSNIKSIVDKWQQSNFDKTQLKKIEGYKARLITINEILDGEFFYAYQRRSPCVDFYAKSKSTPKWFYNNNYSYWTMSPNGDSTAGIWTISRGGGINPSHVADTVGSAIRPVINVYKKAIDN